jgi:hypothetical protein
MSSVLHLRGDVAVPLGEVDVVEALHPSALMVATTG